MYNVTSNFKTNCKANVGTGRSGRIYIVDDDEYITDSNGGNLVSFTIEDNCYNSDTFVGSTEAKKIKVNIINPNNEINLENKEIRPFVSIGDEEIPFGNFIVSKVDNEEVKEKTSFVGYDYLIKFNKIYEDDVTYPLTLSDYLAALCNQCGVSLGSTSFPNSDYVVNGNMFTNGEDCRTVLSSIVQLAGGFAKIGRDNNLYIKTLNVNFENTDETIDGNNYFDDFERNDVWGELNSLVLSMSSGIDGENSVREDDESIAEFGKTEMTIADNYFFGSEEAREELIVDMWDTLKGLKYVPFKGKYYGYPYLDSGDVLALVDKDDNEYVSYVFNHTFTYNGTFGGEIETTALTKTQEQYKNLNKLSRAVKNTQIKVNKIEGQITSIVEEVDGENGSVNQRFTQIYQDINNIINTVQNAGGGNLVKNSVAFALDSNGYPTEWEHDGTGTITTTSDAESLTAGGVSGHTFTLKDLKLTQRIPVVADTEETTEKTYYSFSCRVFKGLIGSGYIKISNSFEEYTITIESSRSYYYELVSIDGLLPKTNYYDIEVYGNSDGVTYTDLMFNTGEYRTQWQQADGEIMNTQVNINVDGVLVKSSVYDGDYTIMSPLEFAGYSNINGVITKVFSLNKDTTEIEKLKVENGLTMNPIKIVPVTSGTRQGWAFVPSTGEEV